jgi:hypothetical protein
MSPPSECLDKDRTQKTFHPTRNSRRDFIEHVCADALSGRICGRLHKEDDRVHSALLLSSNALVARLTVSACSAQVKFMCSRECIGLG